MANCDVGQAMSVVSVVRTCFVATQPSEVQIVIGCANVQVPLETISRQRFVSTLENEQQSPKGFL